MDYKRIAYYAVIGMMMIMALKTVMAAVEPSSPDITVYNSTSLVKAQLGFTVPAQAGNVSGLTISDIKSSEFWQGYYGNVTGRIVLSDSQDDTLYAWELVRPQGEIYAVNTSNTVQWNNLTCVNLSSSANLSEDWHYRINLTTIVQQYNMNRSPNTLENISVESFNFTFNTTFGSTFDVAQTTIGDDANEANCPQLYTFVDSAYQTTDFQELLLHDNDSALVFMTILEDDADGFTSGVDDSYDFQMLVAEDGSPGGLGESILTTYYFYVELQ